MKFADEMKMLLQLQQQTKDNNPDVDLIRGDCDRLHKKLMTALKEHIRHMLVTESYPEKIEGDFELPLRPSVTCKKIPRVPQTKRSPNRNTSCCSAYMLFGSAARTFVTLCHQ